MYITATKVTTTRLADIQTNQEFMKLEVLLWLESSRSPLTILGYLSVPKCTNIKNFEKILNEALI